MERAGEFKVMLLNRVCWNPSEFLLPLWMLLLELKSAEALDPLFF